MLNLGVIFLIALACVGIFLKKQFEKERNRWFNKSINNLKEINKEVKSNRNTSSLYAEWKTKNYFFSKAELLFYKELLKYSQQKNILILSKVRIADLVTTKQRLEYSDYMKTFRSITQKHVDYVVTDYSWKILCVLELDWKSHESWQTAKNDIFKNKFFKDIGLPLLRFQNYGTHNLSQLDNFII